MRSFPEFAAAKRRQAERAVIAPLRTIARGPLDSTLPGIGNEWSRQKYDGDFRLVPLPDALPSVSLVFVQSKDGNTGADDPSELGGAAARRLATRPGTPRASSADRRL